MNLPPNLKLLAIDTATEACSAALCINGETADRYELARRRHAALILPMVDDLLTNAGVSLPQLDAIAFGRGPGAFTGLRIAAGVVQGLAMAADLPVVPVSTLAALAQGVGREAKQVACAMDARMGEVYWALYQADDDNIMRLVGTEVVCPPNLVNIPSTDGWLGYGSGWETYGEQLQAKLGQTLLHFKLGGYPAAKHVIEIAASLFRDGYLVSPEEARPVYLRDKVAQKNTD